MGRRARLDTEGAGKPERRRALFYCHDAFGLGHIRTTLALAGELARRRPDAALLIATGSAAADRFPVPANLDLLRLPSIGKSELYGDLPSAAELALPWAGIQPLRAGLLASAARYFRPHLVHVDHAPVGHLREFAAALAVLRDADPRPALILGLPDIVDEPRTVGVNWARDEATEWLDQVYDRILIYGDRRVFDPVAEYGFSAQAAAKTLVCGYLSPPAPAQPAVAVRQRLGAVGEPLVVVTAGGGEDGAPLLRSALAALHRPELAGVAASVVAGPLLDEAPFAELRATIARPGVAMDRFAADLVDQVAAADAVVTMGGYNTVREVVGLGKRPIVVPRVRPTQPLSEQLLRAQRLQCLGLARLLHPADLTPERLARLVRDELAAVSSPPSRLDFGGLARAGAILDDLLG